MNFYYDILVNMQEDKPLDFYEWMDSDIIEHIRKIPIYRVSSKILKDILEYNVQFDETLLNEIYLKCECKNNKLIKNIEYMFLVTDTKSGIVLELDKEGKVIFISKLLLNDEINLIEIANVFKEKTLKYIKLEKRIFYRELRIEKDIKKFLLCEINTLFKYGNEEKLKYIYYEWLGSYEKDFKEAYTKLKSIIADEFTLKHKYIYDLIRLTYQTKSSLSA